MLINEKDDMVLLREFPQGKGERGKVEVTPEKM